jgi:hypothetical protein
MVSGLPVGSRRFAWPRGRSAVLSVEDSPSRFRARLQRRALEVCVCRHSAIDVVQHPDVTARFAHRDHEMGGRDRDVHLHCLRRYQELWRSKRRDRERLAHGNAGRVIESSSPHVFHAVSIGYVVQNVSIGSPARFVIEHCAVGDRPPRAARRRDHVDGGRRGVHEIVCKKRDPALIRREPLVEQAALRIGPDCSHRPGFSPLPLHQQKSS